MVRWSRREGVTVDFFAVVTMVISVSVMIEHSHVVFDLQRRIFIFDQTVYLREWVIGMICWVIVIATMAWSLFGSSPSETFRAVITFGIPLIFGSVGALMLVDDWKEYRWRLQKHRDGIDRLMRHLSDK